MSIKRIVIIGLLAALCFVMTWLHIPLPFLGPNSMMHLGTVAIYIAAGLIGPEAGIAGAVGCALFDLMTGPVYVIPTLITKGLQGFAAGKIAFLNNKNGESPVQNLIGFIIGGIISLVGYFIADGIIYGNWWTAFASGLGSILTSILGIVFGMIILAAIKPALKKAKL